MTSKRTSLYAVVMAGGRGTRFWPVGRRTRPKQLLSLGGRQSLLQDTMARLRPIVAADRQWIVTNQALQAPIRRLLGGANLLAEPFGRNTAPAAAWAALRLLKADPEAVLLVTPSDHRFLREAAFRRVVRRAVDAALRERVLVTFGIPPSRVETGYGYIEADPRRLDPERGGPVRRFVEKPQAPQVRRYLASGRWLWNCGLFVWRADLFLEQLRFCLPEVFEPLWAIRGAIGTVKEARAIAGVWSALPDISLDHGLLQRSRKVWVLPMADAGWTDMGSWAAVYDALPRDADGNVRQGLVVAHDARGNLVISETPQAVALLGLADHMVLVTGDAILVGPRDRDQEIKTLVAQLSRRGLSRLE